MKNQPKEEVLGRISLRTSGRKPRSSPPNPGKRRMLARTSHADVHEKTLVWKTSGWFFVPYYFYCVSLRSPPTPEKHQWDFSTLSQKSFRNPNPYWSRRKYGNTPPLCTAVHPPFCIVVPCWLLSLEDTETQQYTSHFHCSPICTAVCLPKVRQYFWESTGVGCTPRGSYSAEGRISAF